MSFSKRIGYIPLATLIVGALLFYFKTGEFTGSLFAATLSAGLVLIACVVIEWLVDVFTKNQN